MHTRYWQESGDRFTYSQSDKNNQLAHRPYVPSRLSHQINSRFVQAITDAHLYVSRVQEKVRSWRIWVVTGGELNQNGGLDGLDKLAKTLKASLCLETMLRNEATGEGSSVLQWLQCVVSNSVSCLAVPVGQSRPYRHCKDWLSVDPLFSFIAVVCFLPRDLEGICDMGRDADGRKKILNQDREINGLNEQLEEDAKALEHMQLQLLQERSRRSEVERENTMLQKQVSMLMNMLQ
ncbi:hypothetical protein Sjap_024214 [Stephania japonica]|uniref:Uncharacterized protein n=1 Tax=Stephania japonica TaxID=461633 RepID=A0AAP0EHR9_9MAGN